MPNTQTADMTTTEQTAEGTQPAEKVTRTTVFTLVNPAGLLLKYFYEKDTDPAKVIQFNVAGSSQRFHAVKSEKVAQKLLAKAVELNIDAKIIEVEKQVLDDLKEQTRTMPRLRHCKLVEPKPVKEKKAPKAKKADMPVEQTETPEVNTDDVAA